MQHFVSKVAREDATPKVLLLIGKHHQNGYYKNSLWCYDGVSS
jgi:hypothetical protein